MNSATYGKTRFHFSSDLAGPVIINVPTEALGDMFDARGRPADERTAASIQVEVPGEDIVSLVLDSFRGKLVQGIEEADDETLKELLRSALQAQRSSVREDVQWLLVEVVGVLGQIHNRSLALGDQKITDASGELARALTALANGKPDAAKVRSAAAERAIGSTG